MRCSGPVRWLHWYPGHLRSCQSPFSLHFIRRTKKKGEGDAPLRPCHCPRSAIVYTAKGERKKKTKPTAGCDDLCFSQQTHSNAPPDTERPRGPRQMKHRIRCGPGRLTANSASRAPVRSNDACRDADDNIVTAQGASPRLPRVLQLCE